MKFSSNYLCPCGSKKKYKKCCKIFHNGSNPSNAKELMKSRYSAYAVNNAKYIINTTHKDNSDYLIDKRTWKKNIQDFINETNFKSLEVLEFIDGLEVAFVTFKANIYINSKDSSFTEKSKFVKKNGKWLYLSGDFS